MKDINLIAMIVVALAMIVSNLILVSKIGKWLEENKKTKVSGLKYKKLLTIINETVQREFMYKYKFEYELKDIKIIYKFEDDLKELVERVLTSFNESFLKELEFYHDRTYIIRYVTKNVELLLMEYQKEKKIKTK